MLKRLCLSVFILSISVHAEEDRPMVPGGVDDKPYLTTLVGRVAIGGYAEAHSRRRWHDGLLEESTFELKRWNLFFNSQISDAVRMGAELEFEEGGDEITLEYAAIELTLHPAITMRAGLILAPLGRFNLAHDSPANPFTDRPMVSTQIIGTALTETGVGLFGPVPLGGEMRLTYEIYAVNGFNEGLIESSADGTRIPLGKGNLTDNNNSPAFVGRIAVSPRLGYEIGVSAHHGAYNVFEVEGERLDRRRNVTILALDGEFAALGASVTGEFASVVVDIPPGLGTIYASGQRGWFVDVVRPFGQSWIPTMPESYLEAGVRLESVDMDTDRAGQEIWRLTLGLNFRPTPETVIKTNYVRGREWDAFNFVAPFAGLLFSIATYF